VLDYLNLSIQHEGALDPGSFVLSPEQQIEIE
jgi:hypothetical protein